VKPVFESQVPAAANQDAKKTAPAPNGIAPAVQNPAENFPYEVCMVSLFRLHALVFVREKNSC
jgi:hypothetical protein